MVFLFVFLIVLFIFLSIFTLKIQIRIQDIKFSLNKFQNKYLKPNYKIITVIYILDKIPILKTIVDKKKYGKLSANKKFKNKVNLLGDKFIKNTDNIDINILKFIKNIKYEAKKVNIYIELGTENATITAFIIPILYIIFSFIYKNIEENKDYNQFYLKPIFANKNILNFQFDGIFELKLIHIINTICKIKKERKGESDERTSNRRTYDYSYE